VWNPAEQGRTAATTVVASAVMPTTSVKREAVEDRPSRYVAGLNQNAPKASDALGAVVH